MLYLLVIITIALALKITLTVVDNIGRQNQRSANLAAKANNILHSDAIEHNNESKMIHLEYVCDDINVVIEYLQQKLHPTMDDDTKFFMTVLTVEC